MTQEFKDHIVQHPNRFKRVPVAGTTDQFDLIPTWVENPSEVVQLGTPIDRQLFEGITSQLAETTQNLNSREINVMYPPAPLIGATGDGVSDDTSAINACINYLNGEGGVIRFPVGKFRFTSKITVPNGVTFKGNGMRESFDSNTDNRPTSLLKDGNFDGIELRSSSALEDLNVDGAAGNGGDGVLLMGNKSRLENVMVAEMGRDGVVIGSATINGNRNSWYMSNVASIKNGQNGFVVDDISDGVGPNANAGMALRCNAWQNGKDGWVIGYCAVNTFIQCYAESSSDVGFRVKSTSLRNMFLNCGSEQNVNGNFLLETGSANNLVFGAFEYAPVDNGNNLIMNNTGGSAQFLSINKLIQSGGGASVLGGITAGLRAIGQVPGIMLHDTDSPTNKKTWDVIANSGIFQVRLLDDNGATPVTVFSMARNETSLALSKINGMVTVGSLGVGNSVSASTLGTVTKKMQVFDANGNGIGYVPIYNNIT